MAIEEEFPHTLTIPKSAGIDGDVSIRYRAAEGASRDCWNASLFRGPDAATDIGAKIIARTVGQWNVKVAEDGRVSAAGGVAPADGKTAAKLPARIFEGILEAVMGGTA